MVTQRSQSNWRLSKLDGRLVGEFNLRWPSQVAPTGLDIGGVQDSSDRVGRSYETLVRPLPDSKRMLLTHQVR